MFGFLKLMTKSGRQELVREAAQEYLTPERIAELCADGVALALDAASENMTDERCKQIATGCNYGCDALKHLSSAIDPEGEEGKKVSTGEKVLIQTDIKVAIEMLVTKEGIERAVEAGVKLVP